MKTLYDAHGKKKLVEVTAVELVSESDFAWMQDKVLACKVLRMYFKIVRRTVLAGFDWRFPNGMRLSIRKQRKPGAHGVSRRRDENGERKKIYNTRRPNEQYSIEMYGGSLDKIGYLFDPNTPFRKMTFDRLMNTDTPYSTIAAK